MTLAIPVSSSRIQTFWCDHTEGTSCFFELIDLRKERKKFLSNENHVVPVNLFRNQCGGMLPKIVLSADHPLCFLCAKLQGNSKP